MRHKKLIFAFVIFLLLAGNALLLVRIFVTHERLRSVAEEELSSILPGATIAEAQIEQYSGQVLFIDLIIPRPEGEPLVTIDSVRINFDPISLLSDHPRVRRIEFAGARIDGVNELVRQLPKGSGRKKTFADLIVFQDCDFTFEPERLYNESPRMTFANVSGEARANPAKDTFNFDLAGETDHIGELAMSGDLVLTLPHDLLNATIKMPSAPLTDEVGSRLPPKTRAIWGRLKPGGTASLSIEIKGKQMGTPIEPELFVQGHLLDATAIPQWFPLPLCEIEGTFETDTHTVWLKQLRGRKGAGIVRLPRGRTADNGHETDIEIIADDVPVDDDLKQACPPVVQRLWDVCTLKSGTVDVQYRFLSSRSRPEPFQKATVRLDNCAARHQNFPLPLEQLNGTVEWKSDRGTTIDLGARSGQTAFTIRGNLPTQSHQAGPDKAPSPYLTIRAEQLELGEELLQALPPELQKLWPTFQPKGRADALIELGIDLETDAATPRRVTVNPQGASITYRPFPLKIENLSGALEWTGDQLDLNLTARAGGAYVQTSGSIQLNEPATSPNLKIELRGLKLTPELRDILPPESRKLWDALQPEGVMDVTTELAVGKEKKEDLASRIILRPGRCSVRYDLFPYPLTDLEGRMIFEGDTLKLDGLRGRVGKGDISINGTLVTTQEGTQGDLQVEFQRLELDDTLRSSLPESWQAPLAAWKLGGVADGVLNLHFESVDGQIVVTTTPGSRADIKRLTVRGRQLPNVSAEVSYKDGRLVLSNLSGSVYGGALSGSLEIATADTFEYKGNVSLYGVDLKQTFESISLSKGEVRGILSGEVALEGKGESLKDMKASAKLLVERGNLAKVPALYDLLTVLSLHLPSGTAFTGAKADLNMEAGVINVLSLDLTGPGMPVHGDGTIGLKGELDLTFLTSKSGIESVLQSIPILGPIVTYPIDKFKQHVIPVRVTGTIAKPEASVVPLANINITRTLGGFLRLLQLQSGNEKKTQEGNN